MNADTIDVASWDHGPNQDRAIDWRAVRSTGVARVYVKATEGTSYRNPWFSRDVDGAHSAGLGVGAYHFARPASSAPGAQVAWFARALQGLSLELPPALDLEDGAQLGWGKLDQWGRDWLGAMAMPAGDQAVYANRYYLSHLPYAPWGARLWLADPSASPHVDCWLWQYGQGAVAGVPALVDLNQLRGVTPPPPVVPPAHTGDITLQLTFPQLGQGATGFAVRILQGCLIAHGIGVTVDGAFGPATAAAVRTKQSQWNIAVDGVVGADTWNHLLHV